METAPTHVPIDGADVPAPHDAHAPEVTPADREPAVAPVAGELAASDTTLVESPHDSVPPHVAAIAVDSATVADGAHGAPQPSTPNAEAPADTASHESPAHTDASNEAPDASVANEKPADGKPRTLGIDPAVEARRARAEAQWQRVRGARDNGDTLHGVVTGTTNGGLLVEIGGIRGFLPASQTSIDVGATLDSLVKKSLPLKIIDVDDKRRRVVVSNRRALEAERQAKRGALQRSLAIGQTHEGIVRRLADFGAFVDIGGIDGLVPMSELAFERVDKVSDILAVGDKLTVTVIRIEENGRKIALSRKNALPDPWRDHADVVRQGAIVAGKVVSKEVGKDAGLRVELAPGIIGSIRDSDADPNDYEIGEAIEVVVRYADRKNRRIKLGTVLGDDVKVTSSGGFAPLGLELEKKR